MRPIDAVTVTITDAVDGGYTVSIETRTSPSAHAPCSCGGPFNDWLMCNNECGHRTDAPASVMETWHVGTAAGTCSVVLDRLVEWAQGVTGI